MQVGPLIEFIGLEFNERKDGRTEATLEVQDKHRNRNGVIHGGVISAILDSTMGSAVISAIPEEWWCSTISLSVQYASNVHKGELTVTGRVVSIHPRTAFAQGEVRDESGRLVASAEGSWSLTDHRPGVKGRRRPPHVWVRGTGERLPVGKIVCFGRNYAAHVEEMKAPKGGMPVLFFKPASAMVHNGGKVILPDGVGEVHHEVELVAVIGRRCKAVPREEALDHVLGYAVGLDMTLRDVQAEAKKKGGPWCMAKGFDTSAPVSPVVLRDEVGDGSGLGITLDINGRRRQDSNTSMMLHPVAELVSFASRLITLERGDLLYTGTPEGVGPVQPGDKLEAEIEKVGTLSVSVEEETT